MDDVIVSKEMMRARGADAFKRGLGRDEHGMNHFALGIRQWRQGYDRAATESQYAATAQRGVDIAQGAA